MKTVPWLGRKKPPLFGRTDDRIKPIPSGTKAFYRSVWISDIHLGTRHCQAETLLEFLRLVDSQYLYLVGDIIDGWQLKKSWYWKQSHNDVIQKIIRKARKGTHVIVIPGNHDEFLRNYTPLRFGRIALVDQAIHRTADGREFLVLHGDQFDGVMQHAKWLAYLGDQAYEVALVINRWFNIIRRILGKEYWSLSAYLKGKVKNAVSFISTFEDVVVRSIQRLGVNGVICGHIHRAEMRDINTLLYCNDGDWVESCTALVEHLDGRLEILDWSTHQKSVQPTPDVDSALTAPARAALM